MVHQRRLICIVMAKALYIVEKLGKAEQVEKQRGGKLAVTEKMRI